MRYSWKKLAVFAGALIAVLFFLDARVNAGASTNAQEKSNFVVSEPVVPVLSPSVLELQNQTAPALLNREINPLKWMGDGIGQSGLSSGLDALAADGVNNGETPNPLFTFEAQGNFNQYTPPDTDGDVGPNHYIQMVNVSFTIYDKSGNLLAGPTPYNALFTGAGGNCQADNSGDPVVLYDELADRWILTQFAVTSGQDMCFAVSKTPDPLGQYWLYEFGPLPDFPDYPKLGVWPDAYYMGTNSGFPNAYYAYAFDRVKMLAGQPATYQAFGGYPNFLMPADVDGSTPPAAGTPGKFYTMLDAGYPNHPAGVDRISFYDFDVDWTTPANTTFTLVQEYPIAAYNYTVCGFFVQTCVPQPGTGQTIDTLSYWPMFRLAYRNLGSYEAMVGNFTVDLDNTNKAAIRWFEMRDEGAGWNLYQEGTYAPDSDHRWMGSIAMDGSGNIGMGYSVSSTTTIPSIRYATRLRTDPLGTLQAEATGWAGTGVQTGVFRWGDYSSLNVDPADGCTFWYTTEYHEINDQGFSWNTRVIVFKIPECTGALAPDFTLAVTPDAQAICTPDDAVFNVDIGQVMGYTDPVTLSTVGEPAGTTVDFSVNPVTPPGTSILTFGNTGAAADGSYSIDVLGVAATSTHTSTVTLDVFTALPGVPTLTSPANGATDVSLIPTFQWSAVSGASSYYIEIATDSSFSNVVDSATVDTNSYSPAANLAGNTFYFWRVTASNACGDGTVSSTYHFTTIALLCRAPALAIADNTTATDTFVVGNTGTLQDLNISINASHTYVGDLSFSLTHQDTGTSVTMVDRPGYTGSGFGCANNNVDVELDDEGTDGPVENQCATDPALFGNPTPNNPLSAFDGEDLSGTWIISVTDSAGGDTGTLNEWCIVPTADTPPAPIVDVFPIDLNSAQYSDSVVTQTITINNYGTADLTWEVTEDSSPTCVAPTDLPWASMAPITGTTSVGGTTDGVVTFDSTGLSQGVYTGTLCISSNDANNPLIVVPLEMTIEGPPPSYGVVLSADQATSAEPGTVVEYIVTVTNSGNVTDTFDLSVTGVWTTTLSDASVTLGAGASTTFTVSVTVPADAADGDSDVTTVTATSQGNGTATDSADLTTTADIPAPPTFDVFLPIARNDD